MIENKKLIKINEDLTLITTNHNNILNDNINKKGRQKYDFNLMSENGFKKVKQNKINSLKKKVIKDLDNISKLNKFNYYITIHVQDKKDYYNFTKRLRKADPQYTFLSLASWSEESNLHYHILINSSLSENEIKRRLKNLNYDIQKITNQTKLMGYFRKNISKDIIGLLNNKDTELKEKQIEILQYKNILSHSKNIILPTIIKDVEEIEKELKGAVKKGDTIKYNAAASSVRIDKYTKNEMTILNETFKEIFGSEE